MMLTIVSVLALLAGSSPTQLTTGAQVYEYWCVPCHGPGIGNPGEPFKPGTKALWLKYRGQLPALLTERTDLTPELIEYTVRNGSSIMPFFRKTEISDEQLRALGAWLAKAR